MSAGGREWCGRAARLSLLGGGSGYGGKGGRQAVSAAEGAAGKCTVCAHLYISGLVPATALIGRKSAPMLAIGPMLGTLGQRAGDLWRRNRKPRRSGVGEGAYLAGCCGAG